MKVLLISITIILLTSIFVIAQPTDPPQNPDRVPITGIEYLLIAGGAYGVYRFTNKRNNKNNDT